MNSKGDVFATANHFFFQDTDTNLLILIWRCLGSPDLFQEYQISEIFMNLMTIVGIATTVWLHTTPSYTEVYDNIHILIYINICNVHFYIHKNRIEKKAWNQPLPQPHCPFFPFQKNAPQKTRQNPTRPNCRTWSWQLERNCRRFGRCGRLGVWVTLFILFMEDILHQLIGSLSHYWQGFWYIPGGCLGFLPSIVSYLVKSGKIIDLKMSKFGMLLC